MEFKRTLNLSQHAAIEYLYGSTWKGMFGAPLTQLFTLRDPIVRDMAFVHLENVVHYGIRSDIIPDLQRELQLESEFKIAYVLGYCMHYSTAYKLRHDQLLDRIEKAAKGRHEIISWDRAVSGTVLRPDLILS